MQRRRKIKTTRAREFRKAPTAAEALAWEHLRDRGVLGLKFRRQRPVIGFIVDFYCASHALVVEIDGGIHADEQAAAADHDRTTALNAHGITVVRIANEHVTHPNLTHLIQRALPPLSPSSREAAE